MSYIKDDLYNTTLPTLIIKERKRYKEYPQIGFGNEASVHKYNEQIDLKLLILYEIKKNWLENLKK